MTDGAAAVEEVQVPQAPLIDDATAERLFASEKHVASMVAIEAERAAEHKAAKKDTEAAIGALRRMIQELQDPQATLPFSDADDDEWRRVPLADLAEPLIPNAVLANLHGAGIGTLGALADFQADGVDLTAIDGIGAAAVEKIVAATDAFWKRNAEAEAEQMAEATDLASAEVEPERRAVQ